MSSRSDNAVVVDALAATILDRACTAKPVIVGLTGSVAAGKSTLCRQLAEAIKRSATIETVCTDGFLLQNAILNSRGLAMRKGFPETYDAELLVSVIGTLRMGPTAVPGYSHTTYDVDPSLTRVVGDVDVVLLEGLGFAPLANGETLAAHVDLLIYLDASEEDLETWFRERFMAFWHAAAQDPSSFYAQFRSMSAEGAEQFSRMVWSTINLPNLRNHIVRCRDGAHIVLHKTWDHRLERLRG